ncbi:putative RDD family membrane protein YckC [Anoxybacillus voinovskiensis]|uniref:Putative RDD family membrane protein YckC n=1 Tax=Anoxybacteroides voinovskiense TaxID=230470 RepID=A0A840DWE8_9BACL|nr:RDD family protein [Anoxybacillus voinovskiensis]MBB4074777.1 putative RDD family membrane protein YckC [Anoxybacillus voinovskiensis]GGJ72720.1 putative membrane protein YteJ [Anoxybacillus voinovskiensis]
MENVYTLENNVDITPSQPPRYAGFWMRFWAYLLDLFVVGSIDRLVVYPVFRLLDLSVDKATMFSPIAIATAVVFYGYFVCMTKFFQQTVGKMVFGLKVVTMNDEPFTWFTVLFREVIGKFIAKFILFIGFLFVAFSEKKQGLHDQIADTTVIHEHEC